MTLATPPNFLTGMPEAGLLPAFLGPDRKPRYFFLCYTVFRNNETVEYSLTKTEDCRLLKIFSLMDKERCCTGNIKRKEKKLLNQKKSYS